ncbi:MAG TPA: hypothetical protein VIQ30_23735, partial [Pseudonocardia sp.]
AGMGGSTVASLVRQVRMSGSRLDVLDGERFGIIRWEVVVDLLPADEARLSATLLEALGYLS